MAGGGGLVEQRLGVLQPGELDARDLGELERVADVLERVLDREGLLRKLVRQHCRHAVVAQREAVGRALGEHLERLRRIEAELADHGERLGNREHVLEQHHVVDQLQDRKSTRLNSSHTVISYAVFCLKKKKKKKKKKHKLVVKVFTDK